MHYLTLITAQITSLDEDLAKNESVTQQKKELEKKLQSGSGSSCILQILLSSCNNLRDTFSRAVNESVSSLLEPYDSGTENPDYLEFWDKTDKIQDAFMQTQDCIKFPNGTITSTSNPSFFNRFLLRDGKIYERYVGTLGHEKRTKRAKRLKVLLNYPIRKLYPSLSAYAAEYWGASFHPEQNAYGFYYNPDAFFDWYSIGGRWPALFLVKEECVECSIGERSLYGEELPCPEGYKWVCAARKKDIEWQAIRDWQLLQTKTQKEETKGQCLSLIGCNNPVRYPITFYGFLSDGMWHTQDDIPLNPNNSWQNTQDDYIDALTDDTILIGVDCHI